MAQYHCKYQVLIIKNTHIECIFSAGIYKTVAVIFDIHVCVDIEIE